MAESSHPSFSNANREIMEATTRALREHGYADLTIKRIADEYGKTTAAIHYHYDTKDELLAAFLDYHLSQFDATVTAETDDDPKSRLFDLLDEMLVAPQSHREFLVVLFQMRSQAPYNEALCDRFHQSEARVLTVLEDVIDRGIDTGAFAEVDSAHVARSIILIVDGAHSRSVAFDEDALETGRRLAHEYIESVVLAQSE